MEIAARRSLPLRLLRFLSKRHQHFQLSTLHLELHSSESLAILKICRVVTAGTQCWLWHAGCSLTGRGNKSFECPNRKERFKPVASIAMSKHRTGIKCKSLIHLCNEQQSSF